MENKYQFTGEQIDNVLNHAMEKGNEILTTAHNMLFAEDGQPLAPDSEETYYALQHELANVSYAFGNTGARQYLLEGTDAEKEAVIVRMVEDAYGEIPEGHHTAQQELESHVSRLLLEELGLATEKGNGNGRSR